MYGGTRRRHRRRRVGIAPLILTSSRMRGARRRRHHRMGGFAPAIPLILGTAQAAHSALQKYKPVSLLKNFGPTLPKGSFFDGIRKVGDFAINALGYGRRRPRRRAAGSRRLVPARRTRIYRHRRGGLMVV